MTDDRSDEEILNQSKTSGFQRTCPQTEASPAFVKAQFTCKKCDSVFQYQDLLAAHMYTHNTDALFQKELKKAKSDFYEKTISDLKLKNPGQWYSALKRIMSRDQMNDELIVDEISHLDNQQQAEKIADTFSDIPNQYERLVAGDVLNPKFSAADIPLISPAEVWLRLKQLKTTKATNCEE